MLKILKSFKDIKGVGIVELLIAAFVLLLVCAFTLNAFVGQKDAQNIQAQVSDAQQAATFSMAELTKAVRNAGYRVPVGTLPYRKGIGSLGHDTLIIYNQTDSIRFFLDYTAIYSDMAHPALMRQQNATLPQVFAENIEDVDFTPVGTNTLTLSITARTEKIDSHLNDYRRRTVSCDILMPNAAP